MDKEMKKTLAEIKFDEHMVISVPHQMPVRVWSCKTFEEHALNFAGWDYECFESLDAAEKIFGKGNVPDELADLLKSDPVIAIHRDGLDDWYLPADNFDPEEQAREYLASDDHIMIVIDSLADALEIAEKYHGHKEIEVRSAARHLVERFKLEDMDLLSPKMPVEPVSRKKETGGSVKMEM